MTLGQQTEAHRFFTQTIIPSQYQITTTCAHAHRYTCFAKSIALQNTSAIHTYINTYIHMSVCIYICMYGAFNVYHVPMYVF